MVAPNDGRRFAFSSSSLVASNRCGAGTSTHLPAVLAKSGPETITVGTATSTPSARVTPRSAPR